jgi:large subunit ribosomal protein L22
MEAILRSVRITPRKVGLVADEVRGKTVEDALTYLSLSPRSRTAGVIAGVIKSAFANGIHKGQIKEEDVEFVRISKLLVGQGTTLKRFAARAKGSGTRINKKTSHISVSLV